MPGSEVRIVCAWCKRIKVNDEWPTDSAAPYFEGPRDSHGICPVCFSDAKQDVKRYREAQPDLSELARPVTHSGYQGAQS